MESSMSHHCSTRHRATLVPPTRGVPPPRRCCGTVPALTRCGLLQQCPPGLGSTKTHKRSHKGREATHKCRRIATEVREVLELHRLDLGRVRFGNRTALQGFGSRAGSGVWPQRDLHPAAMMETEVVSISLWTGANTSVQREVFSKVTLGSSVEAASGDERISANLCAEFGRNVDLNLSTRVEVTGSVLDSDQADGNTPCEVCAAVYSGEQTY